MTNLLACGRALLTFYTQRIRLTFRTLAWNSSVEWGEGGRWLDEASSASDEINHFESGSIDIDT